MSLIHRSLHRSVRFCHSAGLQRPWLAVYHFLGLHSLLVSWGIDEGGLEDLPASCLQVHISVPEKVHVCGSDADRHNLGHRFKRFLAQSVLFGGVMGQCSCQKYKSSVWSFAFSTFWFLREELFFVNSTDLYFIAVAEGKSQNVTWDTNKPESLAQRRCHLSVRQSSLTCIIFFFFFSALIWFCTKYICLLSFLSGSATEQPRFSERVVTAKGHKWFRVSAHCE